jgi:hypothetical protein
MSLEFRDIEYEDLTTKKRYRPRNTNPEEIAKVLKEMEEDRRKGRK